MNNSRMQNVVESVVNKFRVNQKTYSKIPADNLPVTEEFEAVCLLDAFEGMPWGPPLPRDQDNREAEISERLKTFVGAQSEAEFDALADYCSVEKLKCDVTAQSTIPDDHNLVTLVKLKERLTKHSPYFATPNTKYKGEKFTNRKTIHESTSDGPEDLEPGKVLVYCVRLYRPFICIHPIKDLPQDRYSSQSRGPIFQQDFFFLGSQSLCELRDIIKCPNDFGPRTESSQNPYDESVICLKELFPSGTLFINNVFYNDMRHYKSIDISEPIRRWSKQRGLGNLEHRSMESTIFDELKLRLGYPAVYIHQGNCEHTFTFSQVNVLQPSDVCSSSAYPYSSSVNPRNSTNCLMCGRYIASWIVVGCTRAAHDPLYVCSVCFHLYNYAGKVKIGNFKAYRCLDKTVTAF